MTTESIPSEVVTAKPRFRGSLVWTFLVFLIPLILIPTITMGSILYSRSRALLLDQINSQLTNLADQEVTAFHDWIGTKEIWLSDIVLEPAFVIDAADLVEQTTRAGHNSRIGDQVLAQLGEVETSIGIPIFDQFLIIDINGNVLASTAEGWVGMNISDQDYFNQNFIYNVTDSVFLIQPDPFYSSSSEQPEVFENYQDYSNEIILMTSTYIKGIYGEKIGYLVGVSESNSLQQIANNTLGLVPGNQLFIVLEDKYCGILPRQGFVFIEPSAEQQSVVLNAPEEEGSSVRYTSYDGSDVIGYYTYSRSLDVGLLNEISQEMILGPVQTLARTMVWISVGVLGVIAILTYILIRRRFLNPLEKVVEATRSFATGNWDIRSPVTSSDEIGMLASSFNEMADDLSKLYHSLESEVSERTQQITTAAEVAHLANSAPNLNDLLARAANLLTERFNYYHTSIFLIDETNENLNLRGGSGEIGQELVKSRHTISVDSNSMNSWVARNIRPRVSSDVHTDPLYIPNDLLPLTRSEACIPISLGSNLLGVLDVHSDTTGAFKPNDVNVLNTLADQLASAIQHFRLLEGTEVTLEEINLLYRSSRQITTASNNTEVLQMVSNSLQRSPYFSALYIPQEDHLSLVESEDYQASYAEQLPKQLDITPTQVEEFMIAGTPFVLRDISQPEIPIPEQLLSMPIEVGCNNAAILPLFENKTLVGIAIVASRDIGAINQTSIQPYANLIELTSNTLNKITALESTQQRLEDLQLVNDFNQTVGNETELSRLYQLIHTQVRSIVGDYDFSIALYDSETKNIHTPYTYRNGQSSTGETYSLGEGLISNLINDRKPLMLSSMASEFLPSMLAYSSQPSTMVTDTTEQAKALGASGYELNAKSWLGIPLVVGSELIGAISLQDNEKEDTFSEQDLHSLSTLSSQIAAVISNTHLLDETKNHILQLETAAEIMRDTNRQFINANTQTEIFWIISNTLQQSPYYSGVYKVQEDHLSLVESPNFRASYAEQLPKNLEILPTQVEEFMVAGSPLIFSDITTSEISIHEQLLFMSSGLECKNVAYLPMYQNEKLVGIVIMSSTDINAINQASIQPYTNLMELTSTALDKIAAIESTQQRLKDLQTLNQFNLAVGNETEMSNLLEVIHEEVRSIVGDCDFSIALYDPEIETIKLPYVFRDGEPNEGEQFLLGQSFISNIIRERKTLTLSSMTTELLSSIMSYQSQPSTIMDNPIEQARAFGATEEELKAKSWLGIPLIVGDELIGAIALQDNENQNSFTEQDQRILNTLSTQIAAVISNASLLDDTKNHVLQLQNATEIVRNTNRQFGQATKKTEVFQIVNAALQQSPYFCGVYIPQDEHFSLVESPNNQASYADQLPKHLEITSSQVEEFMTAGSPLIYADINQPDNLIPDELLSMPKGLACSNAAYLPIVQNEELTGIAIMSAHDIGAINQTSIQPFSNLIDLTSNALDKVAALESTQQRLQDLQTLYEFSQVIGNETELANLFGLIHEEVRNIVGDHNFSFTLYDPETENIFSPYLYHDGQVSEAEPYPLGEGLISALINNRQSILLPLRATELLPSMLAYHSQPSTLVENIVEQANSLGATEQELKAKSWLGIPLIVGGEPVGAIALQDDENQNAFTDQDQHILTTLSTQIAAVISSARLLDQSKRRALHLQTAAEVARDTSITLNRDELLSNAVKLIRERFNYYHAAVFLLDADREFAVIQEATGEAGQIMKNREHRLAVGSKSIIGYVTENNQPLIVNDVTQDPVHLFNPHLPDTRAELGIPLAIGDQVIGALDVQSTQVYAFSHNEVEVLQVLADQLAIAVANSELFGRTQEHLEKHRLVHQITAEAGSSSTMDQAFRSAVDKFHASLGDRISILLADHATHTLRIEASAGYEKDLYGLEIPIGEGITGMVAQTGNAIRVDDVSSNPQYISIMPDVQSELAVPLSYRGELLGVLNVESDEKNAFDDQYLEVADTLAGNLSAIIINARLTERQRQLFEVTSKIRRSANIESIMQTTAQELSRALQAHRTRIEVGGRVSTPVPVQQAEGRDTSKPAAAPPSDDGKDIES